MSKLFEKAAFSCLISFFLASGVALAQEFDPVQDEAIHRAALAATGGQCNIRVNPHSLPCVQWNFNNNPVFPLFAMDWRALQGDWVAVTYTDILRGNTGSAFYMRK